MYRREITQELKESSREYPVVTLLGPRQSGKTTLARETFPDKPYFLLETPDIRQAVEMDPKGFLSQLPDGAILDEIQRVPVLLSYIQGVVDEAQKPGMFMLTGSHQPDLHRVINQSLAGRTAVLTLLPLSFTELKQTKPKLEPFECVWQGAYPRLHQFDLKPDRFFNSYLQTYVERDVRAMINLADLSRFQQFLTLLAGRVGQLVNYSALSNDIGVSSTTIKNWVSVLKASYILFELPPYFENIRKRVVKSPKLYFTDTGLAAFLLGIHSADQVSRDPLRGNLYENLIILEVRKALLNQGRRAELYFYRDSNGNEVDLIVRDARGLLPIEIKSSATFNKQFLKGIEKFRQEAPACAKEAYVLYSGSDELRVNNVKICNLLKGDVISDITNLNQ